MTTLSIVIPVYNGAAFLPGTVDTVLAQSSPHWELIIVDDGSTDGITPELCDRLQTADSRIRTFHKSNGGLSDARNFAFDKIRGQYVAFLDADDLLHPDFTRLMLNAAECTDADIVFGGIDFFKGSFRIRKLPASPRVSVHDPLDVVEKALYQTDFDNAAWGKIYKTSLWRDFRFSKGIYYEDLDLFYKIILASDKIARIDAPLYGYRQHNDSFIHTWSPKRLHVLDVTDRMLQWVSENAPALLPAAADRRMSAHFNILLLLYRNKISLPDIENRCRQVIRNQRTASLLNTRVRLKNRIGALVSLFGGTPVLKLLSHF